MSNEVFKCNNAVFKTVVCHNFAVNLNFLKKNPNFFRIPKETLTPIKYLFSVT